MKIFSNFDTKLKKREYTKRVDKIGANDVLLLSKSKLFRLLMIDLPFFSYILFSWFLIFIFHKWFEVDGILYGALPIIAILSFVVVRFLMKALIDFYMDFLIVTPNMLVRYDQEGIINRDVITINSHSIKTVTIKKKWLLYSIFDNGNVHFLSEWDESHGEIMLQYIYDPETEKAKISRIMNGQ